MVRLPFLLAAVASVISGCSYSRPFRDPEVCRVSFERMERAARSSDLLRASPASGGWIHPAGYAREIQRVVTGGCVTRWQDLATPDQLAAIQAGFTIQNDARVIRPTTIHAGAVNGFDASMRAKEIFHSLGYGVRTEGVMNLGRNVYIGPFESQGAVDQALAVAREAGFISPHVSMRKF